MTLAFKHRGHTWYSVKVCKMQNFALTVFYKILRYVCLVAFLEICDYRGFTIFFFLQSLEIKPFEFYFVLQ